MPPARKPPCPAHGQRHKDFPLALDFRYSYRSEDVVATLDRVCRMVGYPKTIRVDQDTVFVSRDMNLLAHKRGVVFDNQSAPVVPG